MGEVNLDLNGAIRYLNKKHLVFQGDGCACQMLACLSSRGGGSAQGPTVGPTSPPPPASAAWLVEEGRFNWAYSSVHLAACEVVFHIQYE